MTSISKIHTSHTILVAIVTLAVVLVAGTVGSHQIVYARGTIGSHQMVFGNKHFFMAFPIKRVDNGKQPYKQAIEQPTNNDQNGQCLTAGGGSGITGSCTNAATTTTSNTGGIGSIGGSPGENGRQAIEQPTNNNQKALCITLGGNSPISASCTQITASTTSNTGGILGSKP
jgi:hypothetical protein